MDIKQITLKDYITAKKEVAEIEDESLRASLRKRLQREEQVVREHLRNNHIPRRPALASLFKAKAKQEIPASPNQFLYIWNLMIALSEGYIGEQFNESFARQSTLANAIITGEVPHSAAPTAEERAAYPRKVLEKAPKWLDENED